MLSNADAELLEQKRSAFVVHGVVVPRPALPLGVAERLLTVAVVARVLARAALTHGVPHSLVAKSVE